MRNLSNLVMCLYMFIKLNFIRVLELQNILFSLKGGKMKKKFDPEFAFGSWFVIFFIFDLRMILCLVS